MSDIDSLRRLEDKVDKLTEAVVHLARIDERQIAAARDLGELQTRMGTCEKAQAATDITLSKWINRGIGIWLLASGAAISAASLYPYIAPHLTK